MKTNGFPQFHETSSTRALEFSFAPNSTSAVDQTTIKGKGVASVTRNAAGKFTALFQDAFTDLMFCEVNVRTAGDTVDIYGQGGAFTAGTTAANASLVLKLKTGTANTDLAADADTIVSVRCVFRI